MVYNRNTDIMTKYANIKVKKVYISRYPLNTIWQAYSHRADRTLQYIDTNNL